jgi:hypothetical protein
VSALTASCWTRRRIAPSGRTIWELGRTGATSTLAFSRIIAVVLRRENDKWWYRSAKQIAEYEAKIADPSSALAKGNVLDPRQQDALVNRKRPSDLARQREQLNILQRLPHGG